MANVKIPIFNDTYTSVDGEVLSQAGTKMKNCYLDQYNYLRSRPALMTAAVLSASPVGDNRNSGLFWSPSKQKFFLIRDGEVIFFSYSNDTGAVENVFTFSEANLTSSIATVAEATDANVSTPTNYVALAQGANIYLVSGLGTALTTFAVIADADAPTLCTHVDFIDGYLVASFNQRTFQISDVNSPTSWSALSFASAMRNPDKILAIKVYNRQIFLFGERTLEVWESDPTSINFPFSPVPSGFYDIGIFGKYTPIVARTGLYWITDQKKLARYKNGNIEYPGEPEDYLFSRMLDSTIISTNEVVVRGVPFLIFNSIETPSFSQAVQNKFMETPVFNQNTGQWSTWTSSRTVGGVVVEEKFLGVFGVHNNMSGTSFWASRQGATVYQLKEQDNNVDSSGEILAVRTTGHLDFGTNARKRTRAVRFRAKSGGGRYNAVGHSNRPAARLHIRWNDDNRGFGNWVEVPLGDVGDYEIVREFFPRGIYQTRQYEISMKDAANYVFGEVEEDMEILR